MMEGRNLTVGDANGGTRQRILDAAAKVLSVRGYSGTKLSEIATVAQLRAPAIYYYFPSRDELVAEVMIEGQHRLLSTVQNALRVLPAGANGVDRIDAAVSAHLQAALRLSDFANALTRNSGQVPDAIKLRLREGSHAYFVLWSELLEAAQGAGLMSPELDARTARMLVIGALTWTSEWWHSEQGSLGMLIETAQYMVRGALGCNVGELHPG